MAHLSRLLPDVAIYLITWGVPAIYVFACVIMHRISARTNAPIPTCEPTPQTPSLHPLLLGALKNRGEFDARNACSACAAALATVVDMIARDKASFTASERQRDHTPIEGPDAESDNPVQAHGVRRSKKPPKPSDVLLHIYGAGLQLTITTNQPDRFEQDALDLIMPPHTSCATVEDLCRHAESRRDDHYHALHEFLTRYMDDLCREGLLGRPSRIARVMFSPLVNMAVCIWCIFGPAAAEMDLGLIPVSIIALIAVIASRPLLVDLGYTLTDQGADVLGRAYANVQWAEQVKRGNIPASALTHIDTPRLLATLIAMDRHDLAADVAERVGTEVSGSSGHLAQAQQAIGFCTRRHYEVTPYMQKSSSPVDLIIEYVDKLVQAMTD